MPVGKTDQYFPIIVKLSFSVIPYFKQVVWATQYSVSFCHTMQVKM